MDLLAQAETGFAAIDVAPDGALILETPTGLRPIHAGEIR